MFIREDGDHKVLSGDESCTFEKWEDIDPSERGLIIEFFGYKSKIKEIVDKGVTEEYIKNNSN